jgi:hypothetical protein
MAINVADLIERVRTEITMDSDADGYRWTTAVMTDFVVQACQELFRIRKHLLLDVSGSPTSSSSLLAGVTLEGVENNTATLLIPTHYTEALMSGVAMRCFLMDAADQNNAARATYERSRFYELAGVSGASAS